MKYKKCGNELRDNDLFCSQCGESVVENNSEAIIENKEIKNDEVIKDNTEKAENKDAVIDYKKANILTIISAVLMFVIPGILTNLSFRFDNGSTMGNILKSLDTIAPLTGFGTLIYTRIKYPKHIFSKVVLIVSIITFIAVFIYAIAMIAVCTYAAFDAMQNCPG